MEKCDDGDAKLLFDANCFTSTAIQNCKDKTRANHYQRRYSVMIIFYLYFNENACKKI